MKKELLGREIRHIKIKSFNTVHFVKQLEKMAFQAKNLARAARIYDKMLSDKNCSIILTLTGSLFSAGLKTVVYDLIDNNMIDIIVSTGAIIVDQDFFEALGFRHYQGTSQIDDKELMKRKIDRIYDTFIDEEELRICDKTIAKIADNLPPKPYSSREFVKFMGEYLDKEKRGKGSVVWVAYKKGIHIFIPAFSDCSAGFGLIYHQYKREKRGKVDRGYPQMVFSEATIALPLIVNYAYQKGKWKKRKRKDFNHFLDENG